MKNAIVSELKNELSRFLRAVKAGETVIVLERGLPVAELHPRARKKGSSTTQLDLLEDRGMIRRGDVKKVKAFSFPSASPSPSGVLESLLEERRGGR